ncbi:MAG: M14 family zinc carboxypeptidase [Acidobacteriota bacterium]|nr:M14 family zinc carboxypeptidase [Acidobacteriota bacterium]
MLKLLVFLLACLPVFAEFEWLPGGTYDEGIPTPSSFLGYEIGEDLTEHWQMVRYIHRLEKASPRVKLFKIGHSYERRDMYLIVVSSQANMAKLETIRSDIGKLFDPRNVDQAEVDRIAAEVPPIGWLNCANDGDESAAFEVGIQLAYQLAAGNDALTKKIRDNTVTVINIAHNPESHQRFVAWMKAVTVGKNGTADPNAVEHRRDWLMNTNNNHYNIDLNRDAFALSQIETRHVAAAMLHWNPQFWVDNHGQTNEYFFAPYADPVNPNLPPSIVKWATEVGRNNARYFDRFGWTFFEGEVFDLYYPGYWDSFPSFNGAIGMTYETDGGGHNGLRIEKADGRMLTLRGGIHRHFATNMATLEVLADNRKAVLLDFYAFRKSAMDEADKETYKTYVLEPGRDPGRLADLLDVLLHHKIEVYRTDKEVQGKKVRTYFDVVAQNRRFPAGSYIIPLKQPQKRLVKVLFQPDPKMSDVFMAEVEAKRARNAKLGTSTRKERLGFYDVTAWTLPVTYGLDAAYTEDAVNVSGLTRITEAPKVEGKVSGKAEYAYLFTQETDAGAALAGRLLQEDFKLGLVTSPFKQNGKDWPLGTLVARVKRNPDTLHTRIAALAGELGVNVATASTAWTEEGISLGSNRVFHLKKPSIAVLTDRPVSQTGWGSVWFLLEQRYGLEFTAIRADYLANIDLSRYNVIVFPDSWGGYNGALGERGVEKLGDWVKAGGTFVGIKGGAAFAVGAEWTDIKPVEKYNGEDKKKPIEAIPGSIFRAKVNPDYWLAYGYGEEIAVQLRTDTFMGASKRGTNVVSFGENAHLIGHVWDHTEKALAGASYLVDHSMGRGRLVLFADDPTFRNYWRGLDRLFLNAVLFGPSASGGRRY